MNTIKKFRDELIKTTSWLGKSSPDFNTFLNTFDEALNKTCKLEKPKTTKRNPVNNPWITEGIIEAINTKNKFYSEWNDTKSEKLPNGNQAAYSKYCNYRRCLRNIIKRAKSNFNCTRIESCSGDMKKTWKIITEIRGEKSTLSNHSS